MMLMAMRWERFHTIDSGSAELDRLRGYLGDWQQWEERYRVDLGAPDSVPWAKYMKDYMPSGDNEATGAMTFNVPAMKIIDAAIDELAQANRPLQLCVCWRYLNINVAVFRLKRLEGLSVMQLDELADAGERALLPLVKRRGLIL